MNNLNSIVVVVRHYHSQYQSAASVCVPNMWTTQWNRYTICFEQNRKLLITRDPLQIVCLYIQAINGHFSRGNVELCLSIGSFSLFLFVCAFLRANSSFNKFLFFLEYIQAHDIDLPKLIFECDKNKTCEIVIRLTHKMNDNFRNRLGVVVAFVWTAK